MSKKEQLEAREKAFEEGKSTEDIAQEQNVTKETIQRARKAWENKSAKRKRDGEDKELEPKRRKKEKEEGVCLRASQVAGPRQRSSDDSCGDAPKKRGERDWGGNKPS